MDQDACGGDGESGSGAFEFQPADKVTSEVHPFLALEPKLKSLYNPDNVLAKVQFTLTEIQERLPIDPILVSNTASVLNFDADGDVEVPRRRTNDSAKNGPKREKFLLIEHTNTTTLDLVGHQIWRGAFVLSDFIMTQAREHFENKTVLELGSGTGFSGIVASLIASKVVITDLIDMLGLIEANLTHNQNLIRAEVVVRPLDFLNSSWTSELEELVAQTDVILAADVVYHDRITDGFVSTLRRCLHTGKPKTVFIALEKRFVFTLSELDVVAPAYDHFLEQIDREMGLQLVQSKSTQKASSLSLPQYSSLESAVCQRYFSAVCINLSQYPMHFNYEPSKDLVLWQISTRLVQ